MGLTVKWAGKEYLIDDLPHHGCVLDLKKAIYEKTGVKPERQKLIGVKCKGKAIADLDRLSDLNLEAHSKIMMVGSLEENIQSVAVPPEDLPDVVNDLEDIDEQEVPVEQREEFLNKIAKRVETYEVKRLNESRPGKKLLVLDIDYTIFDHRSTAQCIGELMRPFLHEFLATVYEDYDVAIWSATNMKWIETKLKELGVTKSADYKIVFVLDCGAMIGVHTSRHGLVDVKPLAVIWGKFPEYGPENTIMVDDIRRNFLMNPKNGLRVRPFRSAHANRDSDRELVKLARYLRDVAHVEDVRELDHRHWESYKPKKPSREPDD